MKLDCSQQLCGHTKHLCFLDAISVQQKNIICSEQLCDKEDYSFICISETFFNQTIISYTSFNFVKFAECKGMHLLAMHSLKTSNQLFLINMLGVAEECGMYIVYHHGTYYQYS